MYLRGEVTSFTFSSLNARLEKNKVALICHVFILVGFILLCLPRKGRTQEKRALKVIKFVKSDFLLSTKFVAL